VDRPSRVQRSRVVESATDAVRRGALNAVEVMHALQSGDAGIAALIRARARLPQMPDLSETSINLTQFAQPPSQKQRATISELTRVLAEDGDFTPVDCFAVSAKNGTWSFLIRRLNAAWARRCERLTAPIKAILPEGTDTAASFHVMPGALVAAMFPYDYSPSKDSVEYVRLYGTGQIVVKAMVSYADATGVAALNAAWDAVCEAVVLPIIDKSASGIEGILGYLDELITDISLQCSWDGDEPIITQEMIDHLSEEAGLDPDDPDTYSGFAQYCRHSRLKAKRIVWDARSPEMRAWLQSNGHTDVGRVSKGLLALAEYANARTPLIKDGLEFDYSDEGYCCAFLQPLGTGLDDFFEGQMSCQLSEIQEGEIGIGRKGSKGPALRDVLDRAVVDAALVSAAISLINAASCPQVPQPPSAC